MTERVSDIFTLDRAACRQAVLSRFSTARMVEEHVALYDRVINSVRQGKSPVDEARSRPPRQLVAR
jgi:hypothetical protein